MEAYSPNELAVLSAKARKLALTAIFKASSGHPGGSLSSMDALITLYFNVMNIRPEEPCWEDRDRFVLSKGHSAPALYAVLAMRGFFPEEDVLKLRSIKAHYSGHPDMRHVKGVDMSTGSLGQGLSAGLGMALAARRLGKSYRTYVLCGDGELEEGQIWEAVMAGAKFRLDNLCVLVDVNGLQIDGATYMVMPMTPLDEKFKAFNWNVLKVNGHDYTEILKALQYARQTKGQPTVILLDTVKGKGVSFMENQVDWHGKAPNEEQLRQALVELNEQISESEQ